jgi:3-deoxy-7-phosphoheptulonate synthase
MMFKIRDVNVRSILPLPAPQDFLQDLPITDAVARAVSRNREEVAAVLSGRDKRLLVIAGPCSIHDPAAGQEYAARLVEAAERFRDRLLIVMRVYFEKPRTTVGWKGMIYDPHLNGSCDIGHGLRVARRFLLTVGEMGLGAATEFVDPITPQYIADLVAWGAIGARTAESQTHREMASGLSMPVGFKNGTGGSVQLAVDGVVTARAPHAFLGVDGGGRASVVNTAGNPNCHIVLRGGSRGPNYDDRAVADAVDRLKKAGVTPRLVVDCSHGNSEKDHNRQPAVFKEVLRQRLAGNENIAGIMLESHLFPGAQKLDERDPSSLKYGLSITDACIGWQETDALLADAYRSLEGVAGPAGAGRR